MYGPAQLHEHKRLALEDQSDFEDLSGGSFVRYASLDTGNREYREQCMPKLIIIHALLLRSVICVL